MRKGTLECPAVSLRRMLNEEAQKQVSFLMQKEATI